MFCAYITNFIGSQEEWENMKMSLPSHWKISRKDGVQSKDTDLIILMENGDDQVSETCVKLIEIRSKANALIWIWSTSNSDKSKKIYLKLGADGIVKNQLSTEEICMIIDNSMKQHKKKYDYEKKYDQFEKGLKITLDPRNRSITTENDQEIQLTNSEYKMMDILFKNRKKTVTYEEIFRSIWPHNEESDNNYYRIANLICHLRKKLEGTFGDSKVIQTIRSKGYKLNS